MANDFFSTLRVYLARLSEGDRPPAEILASLNTWLRDSGESIKVKIEEEVERTVMKMGLVKRADFDRLKKDVETLKDSISNGGSSQPKRAVKKAVKKQAAKPDSATSRVAKSGGVKKQATTKGKK